MAKFSDKSFMVGNVFDHTYEELVASPGVKTLCTASCLESLPGCETCLYRPYCGTCPVNNYFKNGNIFRQIYKKDRCGLHMGILDFLFIKLKDEKNIKIFNKWINK